MTGKATVIFPGFQGFPGVVGTLAIEGFPLFHKDKNSMIFPWYFRGVFFLFVANFQVQFDFLNVVLAYFWDSLTSTSGGAPMTENFPTIEYIGYV